MPWSHSRVVVIALLLSVRAFAICEGLEAVVASFDPFAQSIYPQSEPPANPAQVQCIYEQGLGRPASTTEIANWANNAAAYKKSFNQVRNEMLHTPEAVALIRKIYQEELGRDTEPAAMEPWLNQLPILGAARVRELIRASPEGQIRVIQLASARAAAAPTPTPLANFSFGFGPATCETAKGTCAGSCVSAPNRFSCLSECLARNLPPGC